MCAWKAVVAAMARINIARTTLSKFSNKGTKLDAFSAWRYVTRRSMHAQEFQQRLFSAQALNMLCESVWGQVSERILVAHTMRLWFRHACSVYTRMLRLAKAASLSLARKVNRRLTLGTMDVWLLAVTVNIYARKSRMARALAGFCDLCKDRQWARAASTAFRCACTRMQYFVKWIHAQDLSRIKIVARAAWAVKKLAQFR